MTKKQRKIIHVDMDCFFAAVEMRENPSLRRKPLGIGTPPPARSVLCTANYEARRYGVKSAMPASLALKLCPDLHFVPPRFGLYEKESQAIHRILADYTDRIESLSLDEAYLDVTDVATEKRGAVQIAKEIRTRVFHERELTLSAGISVNKMLAKIASDWNKPNGLFALPPEKIGQFVRQLSVNQLFGVGAVTSRRLTQMGVSTCGDLQRLSIEELEEVFGSRAFSYYQLCRGYDPRPVITEQVRKSLTVEETFDVDLHQPEQVHTELIRLYQEWCDRFGREAKPHHIRSLVVKLKSDRFDSVTRERKISHFPDLGDFESLLSSCWQSLKRPVRLLGVGVRLLPIEAQNQLRLF